MTPLNKPISRRTTQPFSRRRRLVVTLIPRPEGDQLAIRLERDRAANAYRASLADVFRTLAEWHARAEMSRKKKEREAKKRSRG